MYFVYEKYSKKGWWVAIGAACAYSGKDKDTGKDDLLKASHACGALATVALIM